MKILRIREEVNMLKNIFKRDFSSRPSLQASDVMLRSAVIDLNLRIYILQGAFIKLFTFSLF